MLNHTKVACGEKLDERWNDKEGAMEEVRDAWYSKNVKTWDFSHQLELAAKHSEKEWVEGILKKQQQLTAFFR